MSFDTLFHWQPDLLLFQFDCTNTLNDQVLERVSVQMEPSEGFEVLKCIPCTSLPYDTPGTTYTLVRLPEDNTLGNFLLLKPQSLSHILLSVVLKQLLGQHLQSLKT